MSDHWQPAKLIVNSSSKMWDNAGTTVDLSAPPKPLPANKEEGEAGAATASASLSKNPEKRAEQLMPPFYKTNGGIDKETLKWEQLHRQAKSEIRQSPEYRFVMLIAGSSNQRIERLWLTPSEEPTMSKGAAQTSINESGDSFLTAAPDMDAFARQQQFQHQWAQAPEISLQIHLSPTCYFHVQQALTVIQKHPKWGNIKLDKMIRNQAVVVPFAELIALNMKYSSFLSGLNYNLDNNYRRLKRERKMAMWRVLSALKKTNSSSLL